MSTSTITVGGGTATLVSTPSVMTSKMVEFSVFDQVSVVSSPFNGVTYTRSYPGAESWSLTVTLPPLSVTHSDIWTSALMEMRGRQNAMLLSDPLRLQPRGSAAGAPVANTAGGTGWNAIGTTTLYTRGWKASQFRCLLPGTNLQIGYRLYRVLSQVDTDVNGDASISIWPSLREVPADGQAIILSQPAGLFRLSNNLRKWSTSIGLLSTVSFDLIEYR
jgi:hypothetical protein